MLVDLFLRDLTFVVLKSVISAVLIAAICLWRPRFSYVRGLLSKTQSYTLPAVNWIDGGKLNQDIWCNKHCRDIWSTFERENCCVYLLKN